MLLSPIAWTLETTFPRFGDLPGLQRPATLIFLRKLFADSPLLIRLALSASTVVFILSPVITIFVPLPAFLLPRKMCDAHAHKLATHPIYILRGVMLMIKTIGGLQWGADVAVRAKLAMQPYPSDPDTFRTGRDATLEQA